MKKRILAFCLLSLLLVVSCDFEETLVTNTVHEDGSVTRTVTVRTNAKNKLKLQCLDVPVDSTWQVEIAWKLETLDDSTKQDTVWYLTAEKHFESVDKINSGYQSDQRGNGKMKRLAGFSKSFRWFTTVYRYTESVDKSLEIDCPVTDFLSETEAEFAYWPSEIQKSLVAGSDSLRYKQMSENIETQTEEWLLTCMVRQWIYAFYDLAGNHPDLDMSFESLLAKEQEMMRYLINSDENGDEGEPEDLVFKKVLGEDFSTTFQSEIDSAVTIMEKKAAHFFEASAYNMQIRMPGKVTATNGYMVRDSTEAGSTGVLWAVDPTFFFAQDYEMWVESRVNNYPLWAVTGLFVLFVVMGFVRRFYRA